MQKAKHPDGNKTIHTDRLNNAWELNATNTEFVPRLRSDKGKEFLNFLNTDTADDDFVQVEIPGTNTKVKTILDTGASSNFLSKQFYDTNLSHFMTGKRTRKCVCSALDGVCQENLMQVSFFVTLLNELTDEYFSFPITAYIIDSPYTFILGRRDIKKHALFEKLPSLGYVHGKAIKKLIAYQFREATSEEEQLHLNALTLQLEKLLIKEATDLDEEILTDPDLPWEDLPHIDDTENVVPVDISGSKELQTKIHQLCMRYLDIFSRTLKPESARIRPMHIKVMRSKWNECKLQRTARIQGALKNAEIQRQIDKMMSLGLISTADANQCSQVLMVPKKTPGQWRFCVDYRRLNDCTESSSWPLPRVEDMIERIGQSAPKFFATFDLTQIFYQAPIDPESKLATAFMTYRGIYQWERVPMGLQGAPAYFQKAMST
jgi:hypothetical protein